MKYQFRLRKIPGLFYYLIIATAFLLGYLFYNSYRANLIKECISLNKKASDLENKLISNLAFSLTGTPEYLNSSGSTEKYFLKDNIKIDKWIFKACVLHFFPVFGERISRFLRLCDIATPTLTTVTLPINNKNYFGSIQRLMPAAKHPDSWKDFVKSDNYQIQYLLKAEVMAYLFNIRPDFISLSNGFLYAVDLDDIDISNLSSMHGLSDLSGTCLDDRCLGLMTKLSAYKKINTLSSENYEGFVKQYSIINMNGVQDNFEETAKLINFITEINEADFLSLFEIHEFSKSRIYESYLKSILSRRKNLKRHFKYIRSFVSKNGYKNKGINPGINLNNRYTLEELRNKISKVRLRVKVLKLGLKEVLNNKTRQQMLNVIGCPEARFILNIYFFGEIDFSYDDAARGLKELLAKSASGHEKEAIEYCINLLNKNRKTP